MVSRTLCVLALTAFVAVVVNTASATTDYCNLASCPEKTHTLCKYPGSPISERCGKVRSSRLTDAEAEAILEAHNWYRSIVASGQEQRGKRGPQPAATNLGPLQWDQELSDIAQASANQCTERKDKCRNTEKFPNVGQNIAYDLAFEAQESLKTVSQLVTDWYSQVEYFNSTEVNSFAYSNRTAGYTQLVWAKTTHVGCGVVRNQIPGKAWVDMTLVCNYGPGGNEVGKEIYTTR